MTRLLGYARVSTAAQDHGLQTDALAKAGCQRVFIETVSGAARNRPVLREALGHLEPGDVFVVWKLDRLARSMSQLITTIEDLEGRGVGFKSLSEAMDTTTPGGKLVFHIFGALAEFERSLIRERVSAGMVAAKARGVHVGRPRVMTDETIRLAHGMVQKGMSRREVAQALAVSEATLYRVLRPDAGVREALAPFSQARLRE